MEEQTIINIILEESSVSQKKIAELTGESERWVKTMTVQMQEKGLISRENGKRNGRWIVLVEI